MATDPRSWEDVEHCPCPACRALWTIYTNCVELDEPLFVCDCRMWGRGWQVADVRKLFVAPATLNIDYPLKEQAIAHVLDDQAHCDVYVSSWPLRPAGQADFAWRVETVLAAPTPPAGASSCS